MYVNNQGHCFFLLCSEKDSGECGGEEDNNAQEESERIKNIGWEDCPKFVYVIYSFYPGLI